MPEATEDSLGWDYENVYEWIYADIPEYDFSLNISREHSMTEIENEALDKIRDDEVELNKILKPGPIYIFGWDQKKNCYINDLPVPLISKISNASKSDITVYPGRFNAGERDPNPLSYFKATEAN